MRGIKNPPTFCRRCGGETKRQRVYCSIECSAKARELTVPHRHCICGAPIFKRKLTYCSPKCARAATYPNRLPDGRLCKGGCGKELNRGQVSFCSVACRNAMPKVERQRIKVAAAPQDKRKYNDAQDAIVRAQYPGGMLFEEIQALVNAAGPYQLRNQKQLGTWAKRLNVRRTKAAARAIAAVAIKRWWDKRQPQRPKVEGSERRQSPQPRRIILRELYLLGGQLYMDGLIRASQRDDIDAITRAVRKQEPEHPGFVITTIANRGMTQEWR